MDPADASASEGVMLAFLPTYSDWCKIDLPHMTLVYAGTIDDFSPTDFNNLAKDAATLALLASPFSLVVKGVQKFGPENDQVQALAFQPTPDLWAMRRFVEHWNKSEFPFNPHATIGPVTNLTGYVDNVPRNVMFDRLYLGFGEENLTFNRLYLGFGEENLTFNLRRGNGPY